MPDPTTRVLAVLELLQTHGRMSGAEIARRIAVDPRTVRRYIARLEELGIPITAERGRDGAYQLVAGWKLPPMMFTDDEALALSIGLRAARELGLAEAVAAVASAQAKLERVMPAKLKRRVRAADETVALDLHRAAPGSAAALGTLTAAAQTRTRVHLRYRAPRGHADETARDFDPYGLAYRSGRWFAIGWCHLRADLRSFRLDRIAAVRALDERFVRPAGFDALAYLTLAVATLPRAHAIEVILDADLEAARRAMFPEAGVLEAIGARTRLRSQADDLEWFAIELARLPFAFSIVGPAALRGAMRAVAQRLVRGAES